MALPVNSKILFLYLIDKCDNAGFIEENAPLACVCLGISELEYQGALKGLGRGIKGASGWLWIRRFLRHQKNLPLNPQNPAHRQIARLLSEQLGRFDGMSEFQEFISPLQGAIKGLSSPLGTGTGTGTGKKKGSTEGKQKVLNRRNGLVDSEWIAGVKQNVAYAGIDVDRELNKCVEWFKVKGITPTRQRFLNWLNKADKPLRAKPQQKFKDVTSA